MQKHLLREVGGKNFVERLSALKNKAPEIVVEKITRHVLSTNSAVP
jgi:hypothetical protein